MQLVSFYYLMLFTWKWTLETIPLNNERLSLVKTKLPIKTSTPITNLHELIRNEFQILYVRKLKENGVNVSEVLYNFPPDILNTTFFRLLRTIKRYYNNRWSFWAAILIRSSLAVWRRGGGGVSHQSFIREIPSKGPTLDPFIYHFW